MNGAMPWYIKFLYTFGIPATLAIYLVWFMVNRVDTNLDKINNTLAFHQVEMSANLKQTEETKAQLLLTNLLLQRICVNTAVNQQARNNCFGPSQ